MAGKGDKQRPRFVEKGAFDDNYELVFGKWMPSWAKKKKKKKARKSLDSK